MPRGPSRPWKALAPHTSECMPFIRAAISQGFGKVIEIKGIEGEERAANLRRGIYNAARHNKVSAEAGKAGTFAVGDEMGVHKNGGTFTLRFRVWDKAGARKRHIEAYGTNRDLWPYNPRQRTNKEIDNE